METLEFKINTRDTGLDTEDGVIKIQLNETSLIEKEGGDNND